MLRKLHVKKERVCLSFVVGCKALNLWVSVGEALRKYFITYMKS